MLAAEVKQIDGVVLTHDHADHTHGIDDLRVFAYVAQAKVPVFMDETTRESVTRRFAYCFASPDGSNYPPILRSCPITHHQRLTICGAGGDISFLALPQHHGKTVSLGLRFGRGTVYPPDISDVPSERLGALEGLDLWIVDALRPIPHPSHFSLDQSLAWIEHIGARRAVLTHMHIDLDYRTLCNTLPPHVRPAYDGMVLDIPEEPDTQST